MDRLETRELAYFVAVAEERHFGRAARRLGIAQPPLSRAIKLLERRLGVPLLDRDVHPVALTAAGEVLLHEGRKALDAVAAAARRAQRAGRTEQERRLVLAVKPGSDGGLLPGILEAYAAEPDSVPVDVHLCGAAERAAMLRDGRADAGLLHRPRNDFHGLDAADLLVEPQVAVLPPGHRLAARRELHLADLAGEPLPRYAGLPADGATGPQVADAGQLMQLIALGRAVAVLPESVRDAARRDLVCVPVPDAHPTTLTLAWPEESRSRATAAFARSALAVAEAAGQGRARPA